MCSSGLLHFEVQNRAYNANHYGEFLDGLLNELDARGMRGSVLIMDNCPIHKCGMIRDQVEGRRYRIAFLPPYSPQLNPIEEVCCGGLEGHVAGSRNPGSVNVPGYK
jgi:hypothetical protein